MTTLMQPHDAKSISRQRLLVILGGLQLLCYVTIAYLSRQFLHGEGFTQRPILQVLGLFSVSFFLYLASYRLVMVNPKSDRNDLRIVLLLALAFRLVQLFANPIQEVDIYRYLWDGQVLASGSNPFAYSPQQIELSPRDTSDNRLLGLQDLSSSTPAIETIFERVHFRSVPTVYPPISQLVFALAARLTPDAATLETHLLVMKGIFVACDLATVMVLAGLLAKLEMPPALCLAYAWCPLVIKEIANSGHLDAVAVFLTSSSIALTAGPMLTESRRGLARDIAAGGLWGLAILAKFYPIVLAPLLATWWWRRQRWFAAFPLLAAGLMVGGFQLAFQTHSSTGDRSLEGLGVFLTCWEMNDLAFACVIENLDPYIAEEPRPWFSLLPHPYRDRIVQTVQRAASRTMGWELEEFDAAFLLARVLTSTAFGGTCLFLALKPWHGNKAKALCRRVFLTIAWFWFLIPTQNPWYWTWALPFVVFVSWPWLLVSGFAMIYYFRFWLEYHYPNQTIWPTPYTGLPFFDYVVVWLEHLPVLLLILAVSIRAFFNRGRDQQSAQT